MDNSAPPSASHQSCFSFFESARRDVIDRTPYKTDRKISFVSYHTRSISMNITRAEAWQLHKAVNTAKGNLCRHRDRNPTGGA